MKTCLIRRRLSAGLGLAMLHPLAFPGVLSERPIKLIVPAGAGGISDLNARVISPGLAEKLGQSVIVENRAGGAGAIGAGAVAQAAADGHTLLVSTIAEYCITPNLSERFRSIVSNLVPVILLTDTPLLLVANPGVPFNNLAELKSYAGNARHALSFATAGNGTLNHLAGLQLGMAADVRWEHIPYKSGAESVAAVLGGQVPLAVAGLAVVRQQIAAKRLKVIGIFTERRLASDPEWPTFVEQGLANVVASNWVAMSAPRGTPPDTLSKINEAANEALATPAARKSLEDAGSVIVGGKVDVLVARAREDGARYEKIIRATGLKLE